MKIKVIDLINMISKGEELPREFIFDNKTFELEVNETSPKSYYYIEKDRNYLFKTYISDLDTDLLNREVEIIEEDKKIKELEIEERENENQYVLKTDKGYLTMRKIDVLITGKINELVKEINKIKEN